MPNQKRALDEGNNLIISASAGSGKTTVLIEKIFRVIRNGGSLKNMAVMTFTDLAATELKDRLSDKLLMEIRNGIDAERLKKELDYIPFADVSTIHAFCKRLYKKYYAEIGEDYFDETLNGDEAAALFYSCAERAIAEKRSQRNTNFDKLFWHFYGKDRGGKRLINAIVELHNFLECIEDKQLFIDQSILTTTLPFDERGYAKLYFAGFLSKAARLNNMLGELDDSLRGDAGYESNAAFLAALSVSILSLVNAVDYKDLVQKATTAQNVGLPKLQRAKFFDKGLADKLARLRTSYKELLEKIIDELSSFDKKIEMDIEAGRYVNELLAVTKLAEELYDKAKKQDGKLDFADLEKMALKVLDDKDRLEEVCLGYSHVFLDEYQDTNYLQNKILTSISANAKVFVVGDIKQSIYQFRYAEPAIFLRKFNEYEVGKGGVSIPFNDNFRSDKRILDFVNDVFSAVMTLDFGGVDYRNKARFVSGLGEFPQVNDLAAVELVTLAKPERSSGFAEQDFYDITTDENFIEEGVDKEAEYISSKIKKLCKQNIYDAKTGSARRAKLEDVAILVNTHSQAKRMSRILTKRGVANYVYSGDGEALYTSDRDFIFAYLRLLDNIHDDNNLAVVLLSPLTTFTMGELVEIRGFERDKPFWVSFTEFCGAQKLRCKIDNFIANIAKHRAIAATSSIKTLVQNIVKDYSYDAYIMGGENGAERIQAFNVFIESLSSITAAQDLPRFIAYLDSGARWSITPPAMGGDYVSIMTIHASKGLEFPVVFVPYADYEFSMRNSGRDKDFLIADREYGIALDYYDDTHKTKSRTIAGRFLEGQKKHKELEEKMRLMYVALTRAKNHLFVTMQPRAIKKALPEEQASFAKWLNFARLECSNIDKLFVDNIEEDTSLKEDTKLDAKPYNLNFDILKAQYKYAKQTTEEVKYTVTALTEDEEKQKLDSFDDQESERIRLTGVAYHAVLERLDFRFVEPGDICALIRSMVLEGEISEEIACEIDAVRLSEMLKMPIFDYARNGIVEKEKSFMLYLPATDVVEGSLSQDRVLVQGVIDLIIRGDRNILVDYKYSSLSGDMLKAKYQKQVEIYRMAVERLMKIKIDKTIIIALKSGKTIEID